MQHPCYQIKSEKQTPGGDKNQHNSRLMGESGVDLSSLDRLAHASNQAAATIKVAFFMMRAFNSTGSPETHERGECASEWAIKRARQ
jgi:hypothetical protein